MNPERLASSIEASFAMEGLEFDEECRARVRSILNGELDIEDAIAELNRKYGAADEGSGLRV